NRLPPAGTFPTHGGQHVRSPADVSDHWIILNCRQQGLQPAFGVGSQTGTFLCISGTDRINIEIKHGSLHNSNSSQSGQYRVSLLHLRAGRNSTDVTVAAS